MSGILLLENEYVHVINNDTAEVKTIIGPQRVLLAGNEKKLSNKMIGRIVRENQYAIIKNPYNAETNSYEMGQRKIVEGPVVIIPRYKEVIQLVEDAYILGKDESLRLMTIRETDDKPAGYIWTIRGPCRYIPDENTEIASSHSVQRVNANEGIYVQNTQTSEKKLVVGPKAYMYGAYEVPFEKKYTTKELIALNLLQESSSKAAVIRLMKGELVCVLSSDGKQNIIAGPRVYMLKPDETVKILELSAGKPKIPRQIYAAKIIVNPDFMSDRFTVRTLDNAALNMLITYKREFFGGLSESYKIFSLPDFIGYTCTTLCSRIREEAAKYTFEQLHLGTVGLLRSVLFSKHTIDMDGSSFEREGYYFPEIKLLISEIDVKDITPVNAEINDLLNQSIKSNMIIFGRKMEQEANLQAEKEKIKAEEEISKLVSQLISIENENSAKQAKNQDYLLAEVEKMKSETEAQIATLNESEDQTSKRIQKVAQLLASYGDAAKRYFEMNKLENFKNVKQSWVVSSESSTNLQLP